MNRRRVALWVLAGGLLLLAGGAAAWRFGRTVDVAVARVAAGSVVARVVGPGTVQARVPVTLSARINATVLQMQVDVGDTVQRGQLLALLDDRDLGARRGIVSAQQEALLRNTEGARATLAKAQADLDLARSRQQRDAQLLAQGFVSQAVLDGSNASLAGAAAGVEAARAALAARGADARSLLQEAAYADALLSNTRITAPMDGLVVQRLAEAGSTTVPGTPLLKLVDPASLWVATRVDEAVVGRVQPGQVASIRLRSGAVLSGQVARIARQSDAATRELDVFVAFDEVPARLAIDQEAEVRIEVGADQGLRVPLTALTRDRNGRQGVLVVADGRTRFQPVETAAADAGQVLVRSGVQAGDAVVAVAAGVVDHQRVRPVAALP